MAQDWFEQLGQPVAAPPVASIPNGAPTAPGVIYGRPKAPPPPPNAYDQGRNAAADARAERDQQLQEEAAARAREKYEQDERKIGLEQQKVGVEQGKAGSFALRARDSMAAYNKYGLDPDSLIGTFGNQAAPSVTALASSDERNAVRAAEREFIGAVLRYDSGAAIPPSEFESAYLTYFPSSNAGPEEIAQKKRARETAFQGLLLGAGPAASKFPDAPAAGDTTTTQAWTPEKSVALWGEELYDANGAPLGPDGGPSFDKQGNPLGTAVPADVGAADPVNPNQAGIDEYRAQQQAINGAPGMGRLVEQGMTFGLSDEATGVGNSVARLLTGDTNLVGNYQIGRDAYRQDVDEVRARSGGLGTAVEIGGALLSARPNALISAAVPTTLGGSMRAGARVAAPAGAAAGFGYGEGAEGSIGGAAIGAGLGAGIGAAIPLAGRGVNALLGRAPTRPTANASSVAPADVAAAGQAEGVTVRRAMVDPAARNRVIGAEKSLAGGPTIQRGMQETANQIEGRVQNLGAGGTAMNDAVTGNTVQDISERIIDTTGKALGRRYDRAVQLSGGVKLPAPKANAALDDSIDRLSKTPTTNKAEIDYLNGLKNDLSKPIDVEGLRDLRTTLRKRIAKGELVFGQNEARVLGVMDALSDDIATGLRSAGKGAAAKLFATTDKDYRQRMDLIQGTIQKLIGKRGSTLTPGQVAANFRSMATPKGDEAGLAKMMQAMTPEERGDIAATFAEALGKNRSGEFSTAFLASQAENIPEAARRHIFGPEGAESLRNLVTLAKAHKAVPMGGSPTGAANDYRSWLGNLVFGAGLPLAAGGGGASAVGGAVAIGGIKAGRDILTARALMSPKITKWIVNAPRTTNPAAIDAHFQRLSRIAAQEPALAGDIQIIQQRLMEAAQQSPGRLAAEEEDNRRPEPPQR